MIGDTPMTEHFFLARFPTRFAFNHFHEITTKLTQFFNLFSSMKDNRKNTDLLFH